MSIIKKIEISGDTVEEAMEKVKDYFTLTGFKDVKGDATQALRLWLEAGKPKSEFFGEYLEKKRAIPGEAYRITDCYPVADSRNIPFKFENIRVDGIMKVYKTWFWVDVNTGEEILKITSTENHRPTKAEAVIAMKKLIKEGKYKGKAKLYSRMEEMTPNVHGVIEYTPSKNSHPGAWTVFGLCKE